MFLKEKKISLYTLFSQIVIMYLFSNNHYPPIQHVTRDVNLSYALYMKLAFFSFVSFSYRPIFFQLDPMNTFSPLQLEKPTLQKE